MQNCKNLNATPCLSAPRTSHEKIPCPFDDNVELRSECILPICRLKMPFLRADEIFSCTTENDVIFVMINELYDMNHGNHNEIDDSFIYIR